MTGPIRVPTIDSPPGDPLRRNRFRLGASLGQRGPESGFPCGVSTFSIIESRVVFGVDRTAQLGVLPAVLALNRRGYGSTVCINITSYADHSDRLKYKSRPDDQGWIIGA